jgi:hypothetical protein
MDQYLSRTRENESLRAIESNAFAASSATYEVASRSGTRTDPRNTQHEVPTYFGELEENDLVIERCEAVLAVGTWEAEGLKEDPGRDENERVVGVR